MIIFFFFFFFSFRLWGDGLKNKKKILICYFHHHTIYFTGVNLLYYNEKGFKCFIIKFPTLKDKIQNHGISEALWTLENMLLGLYTALFRALSNGSGKQINIQKISLNIIKIIVSGYHKRTSQVSEIYLKYSHGKWF